MKYAIIENGGKQYKVQEGAKVRLEKINGEKGQGIEFVRVLAIGDDQGLTLGAPVLESAKVVGEIVQNAKSKKVLVFKKKRRKGYSKRFGHRQAFTEVLIQQIVA